MPKHPLPVYELLALVGSGDTFQGPVPQHLESARMYAAGRGLIVNLTTCFVASPAALAELAEWRMAQEAGELEDSAAASGTRGRGGRLSKAESDAKRSHLLAVLRQHPSLKDDPERLADLADVSESTARRWLEDEEKRYRASKTARPDSGEE